MVVWRGSEDLALFLFQPSKVSFCTATLKPSGVKLLPFVWPEIAFPWTVRYLPSFILDKGVQ